MAKKTKTWNPVEIWEKHLSDLETKGECDHNFQNFTKEEKIKYVKEMLNKLEPKT